METRQAGRPPKERARTARISLKVFEELKDSISKLANIDGRPMNNLIEEILQSYVDNRADDVTEYDSSIAQIRQKRAAREKSKDWSDDYEQ